MLNHWYLQDFSLDDSGKEALLAHAKKNGIESLIIISTCNRTELYGFAEHPYQLIHLLCEHPYTPLCTTSKLNILTYQLSWVPYLTKV